MSSAAQALANASNAQKSTGPRTEAGKSKSKNNSMAHGLNAEAATLFSHSPYLAEEFHTFRRELLEVPTQGKSEELAFDRWAFSAFQAIRARQLEAMAESDARVNYGDDQFERRWQRMAQTRLRLEREAANARKDFYALQDRRLCMEAEQAAEAKRSIRDKNYLQAMREKAKENNRAYQDALLAYKQRLAETKSSATQSPEPPPIREYNLDLTYEVAPDMDTFRHYQKQLLDSVRV